MDKKIKESKRGLTFSFTPTETMQIGSRYDYIISNSAIRIVPSETGRYTVSRKRSGSGWNPLIDLRNREVLDAIAGMENIRLHITADSIRIELSLPANATVSAVCQALKYCYSTRSVSDARIRATDCRGRTAKEILEDLDMADDSLDRLKTANPYIANEKLDDRYRMTATDASASRCRPWRRCEMYAKSSTADAPSILS